MLAVTDKDSYGGDELPKLSITISNEGDEPCLMNVGTTTQKFEITSGSDVWWRSTDCQTESSDQVVQIVIEIPKKLNEKQKQLLRDFAATEDSMPMPQKKGFWEKLKEAVAGD